MAAKKRRRPIHLHVMVSEDEQVQIQERMAQAGIRNMGAYMRRMALCGYVLQIDLAPVRELVSLQRRCSNNLRAYPQIRRYDKIATKAGGRNGREKELQVMDNIRCLLGSSKERYPGTEPKFWERV